MSEILARNLFNSSINCIGLGVESYGVTMTTLEQVFLKLAEDNDKLLAEQKEDELASKCDFHTVFKKGLSFITKKREDTHDMEGEKAKQDADTREWDKQYKPAGILRQFREMLRKRFISSRRDKKGLMFQILVPVVTVALVMLMLRIKIDPSGPKLFLNPSIFGATFCCYCFF